MKPIIRVEHLSKQYRIGARRNPHPTLRESIAGAVRTPLNWLGRNGHSEDNTIWALRDVSFEVMPGEVIGIIGRNGAGKSTLLKILSRITEPTTGQVDLYGRVGSLLEVGTGFHAELSGRENIYLNGAILGMKRSEIDRKFDEIVAFAEVEKFIETPVKHYSSGMYMRLAFAVAAHLEPEILLVDEVLAVGDAAFQKKCLGKMKDVADEGRTVLLVSHNMQAVTQVCSQAIWLQQGQTVQKGEASAIVSRYLGNKSTIQSGKHAWEPESAPGNQDFRLLSVRITDEGGRELSVVDVQKPFFIEAEYEVFRWMRQLRVFFNLYDSLGQPIFSSSDVDSSEDAVLPRSEGLYRSTCEIWPNLLKPGDYELSVGAVDHGAAYLCNVSHLLGVHVTSVGAIYATDWHLREGAVAPRFSWAVEQIERVEPEALEMANTRAFS
jgi:lipopolysaccharide transport system ATP-binding protein